MRSGKMIIGILGDPILLDGDGDGFLLVTAGAAAPDPTSVNPSNGILAGGTAITITGTDFVDGATVTVGGSAATNVTFVNDTSITCDTPAHVAGLVDIVVTNPDAQEGTLSNSFTYDAAPIPTSIDPATGPTIGTISVTITGTDFVNGATVTFDGDSATSVVFVNDTSITCDIPAHIAAAVDVVVTNPDAQFGTLASGFEYLANFTWWQDDFTGTNGDSLVNNHTPDIVNGSAGTGNAWESGADTNTIQSNAANNNPGLEASIWDADAAVFTVGTYSWAPDGGNTISNDANTLKVTYVNSEVGARDNLTDAADLTEDLVVGKIYKFFVDSKVGAGDTISYRVFNGADVYGYTETGAGFTSHSFYFTAKSASSAQVRLRLFSAGEEAWVDNLALQEITLNELFAAPDMSVSEGIFDIDVTIPSIEKGMAGLVLSLDDKDNPANYIVVYYNRGIGKIEVWKSVAGFNTSLMNITTAYGAGDTLRATLTESGSDLLLDIEYNGGSVGGQLTISNAGIVGNTRQGTVNTDVANSLDNFLVTIP